MNSTDRRVTWFTALGHSMFHTYELSIPLFVGLWIREFGLSAASIGLIVGLGYALIGVGAPISGVLSDYFGSRRLILVSVLGMGGGFALLSLASGPVTLAVCVVLWGVFASLYHPSGLSLISRTATERGTVFAYHGAGGNIGTAVGPLCTAILLSIVSWQFTAAILVVPAILAAIIGTQITFDSETDAAETTRPESVSVAIKESLADSRQLFTAGFVLAFIAVLLYGTYYRGLLTFMPDILSSSSFASDDLFGWSVGPEKYIYTGMLTVGIAGQYFGGKLTDQIESLSAFLGALCSLVVLAFLFIVVEGFLPLLIVSFLLGFFVYATAPIYQVVIAEQAPDDLHGLSYGYTYLAMFGIGAIGATLSGTLLTYTSIPSLFTALALLAAVGCLTLLGLRRL